MDCVNCMQNIDSVQVKAETFSREMSVSIATKLFLVTSSWTFCKFNDTIKAEFFAFAHFKYFQQFLKNFLMILRFGSCG